MFWKVIDSAQVPLPWLSVYFRSISVYVVIAKVIIHHLLISEVIQLRSEDISLFTTNYFSSLCATHSSIIGEKLCRVIISALLIRFCIQTAQRPTTVSTAILNKAALLWCGPSAFQQNGIMFLRTPGRAGASWCRFSSRLIHKCFFQSLGSLGTSGRASMRSGTPRQRKNWTVSVRFPASFLSPLKLRRPRLFLGTKMGSR